jgi:hypothetical protein
MFEVGKFYTHIQNKPCECLYVSPKGNALLKFNDESEALWRWNTNWQEVKPKKKWYNVVWIEDFSERPHSSLWFEDKNSPSLIHLRKTRKVIQEFEIEIEA